MIHETLIPDGWNPIDVLPDNARIVQVMYDDGSTSDKALGFCDEISLDPPTGKRVWWEVRKNGFNLYPYFMAWRDL